MIVISHRGNLRGSNPSMENRPDYIDDAIDAGFDVEVDVWLQDDQWWLGHDQPQYQVSWAWLVCRKERLWAHVKNTEALVRLNDLDKSPYHMHRSPNLHYFWHDSDRAALTSRGFIWAFPSETAIPRSIAVMPELAHGDLNSVLGVCTDYPEQYQ